MTWEMVGDCKVIGMMTHDDMKLVLINGCVSSSCDEPRV